MANVLEIYKTQIRPHVEFCTQERGSSVVIEKLQCNIKIVGHKTKSHKTNKKSKIFQSQGEIKEIKINFLTRKKNER